MSQHHEKAAEPDLFTLNVIGRVRSPFRQRFATPRQSGLIPDVPSEIWLRPDIDASALDGLLAYSHVWLIFLFHENRNWKGRDEKSLYTRKTKVHPPRLEGKPLGIFATRSPHRPNPIGLSAVRLEAIEGRVIRVKGADLLDGTPILDIKPYIGTYDAHESTEPGWIVDRKSAIDEVIWTDSAKEQAHELVASGKSSLEWSSFQLTVEALIRLDPRPVHYREEGFAREIIDGRTVDHFGFRFGDFNIVFRLNSTQPQERLRAEIVRVEDWDNAEFRS